MATYDDLLKQAPEYTPGAPAAIDGASAPMGAPGSIAPAHVDARCAAFVDRTVEQLGRQADALIPVLQSIQKRFGYLPREALEHLCEVSEITPRDIAGVSTFYSRFRHEPAGTHIISVCHGTACHVKGAPLISSALRRYLKLEEGQTTSADGVFTLDSVDCLGCCTLAPVVQIDGITYGHVTPDGVGQVLYGEWDGTKEYVYDTNAIPLVSYGGQLFAARASSTGSAVSEYRMVSPMPSASRLAMPAVALIRPSGIGPASVTPRCSGCSVTSASWR